MKEKKTHGVQLLVRAVVRDPDGKIITDTGRKPAKSFLIQFLESVYGVLNGVNVNATHIGGGEVVIVNTNWTMNDQWVVDVAITDDAAGIVIGTGDTAETNADYKLETQLTEGTGAGEITHGEQVIGSAAVVGANVDLELKRAFTNATGSAIIVKEAGLYYGINSYSHCTVRDVLAGGVEVPDKCSLTIIYTVRTTV